MKALLIPSFLLIVIVASSCSSKSDRKLVWSDEFDHAVQPDSSKWNYELGDGCPDVCGWGNNEAQYYTSDSKNVRIDNGLLVIEAHKDSLEGKAYTSSRLVSKHKGDWTYGRIEVKAKLPHGKGTWPAIWMLSTDWKYGGWPASGEIDIMERRSQIGDRAKKCNVLALIFGKQKRLYALVVTAIAEIIQLLFITPHREIDRRADLELVRDIGNARDQGASQIDLRRWQKVLEDCIGLIQ